MTPTATTRRLDETTGAIRVEDLYDTHIEDLWSACTEPDRLSRWIAKVTGDVAEGATVEVCFTSTATGPVRIESCDAPTHLLLTCNPGAEDEGQIEAWLTPEGDGTRLVVEERGLPGDQLHFYDAGWRTHLEDLATALSTGSDVHPGGWSSQAPAEGWQARFKALLP